MKVAFVSQPWSVPSIQSSDSVAIWTCQVANRLVRSCACDIVLYSHRRKQQHRVEWRDGIEHRRFPVDLDRGLRAFRLLDRWQILPAQRPFFASPFYYLAYIFQIARDLQQQQCDIVHIHNFSQFVPIIRAFNPNIKIVLHMHCEWLSQLAPTMIEQRLNQVDRVIGCSEYITDKVRKQFPQFADRCQTVFNGVDVEHFMGRNDHPTKQAGDRQEILFVGRISPEKGLHVLIDAFQEIAAQYPQAQLKIIGPETIASKEFIVNLSQERTVTELAPFYNGSYMAQLQSRIKPELANRITFTGGISAARLPDFYWNADILVNPSLSEAFGMSLVEAMATEMPVIGARVGGMTSIIQPDQTGLLVEPGDASSLAAALRLLLSNSELRSAMGKAGRARVLNQFSWYQVADTLLSQYNLLCEPQNIDSEYTSRYTPNIH